MPNWLEDAIFYEIYPQSFYDTNADGIGDIKGIEEKLPYVKSLGCNAIWLNPLFDSPFLDAGYDVRDYTRVADRYGTNEDLIHLFSAAHEMGIRILLDLVPGHTSDRHSWFHQSAQSKKNDKSNRYIWTDSVWEAPTEYKLICGVTPRDGNYLVNFFSSQPALNYGFSPVTHPAWQLPPDHPDCLATVEEIKRIMRFWLDLGCDGFRVDMADSLVKNEGADHPETAKIWRGIRQMLDADYPDAVLVSEWGNPSVAVGSAGFHCDFYLDHLLGGYHNLLRSCDPQTKRSTAVFSSENEDADIVPFLEEYVRDLSAVSGKGYISLITCNHDTPRLIPDFSVREAKIAYAFLFTLPNVPFLYYGDEIGMRYLAGMASKEGGYRRTGTRTPMQWDSGKNFGFSSADPADLYLPVDPSFDAPNVLAQEEDPDSLLNTLRRLTALRHACPDLRADGPFEVVYAEHKKFPFLYRRGKYLAAVNPTAREQALPFAFDGECVFSIGTSHAADGQLVMQPRSFLLLRLSSVKQTMEK